MNFKYFITVIVSLLFTHLSEAQNNKDWNTYLAYHNATGIAETNERIFVLANGALYSYGKNDGEIFLYSKQNGLSDTDIRLIKYSPDMHTLVIVYSNGNIDLYGEGGFKNIPHLKNSSNVQSKTVNDIYFYNHFAYFSTDFGILAVNLDKQEILDTYKLDKVVNSVCIWGDTIIASTKEGLLKAHTKANLVDTNVWEKKILSNAGLNQEDTIIRMNLFKDHLIFCVKKDGLYYETSEGETKTLMKQSYIKDITVQNKELIAYTADNLYIYSDMNNFIYVNIGIIEDVVSLKEDGKYWIASGTNGLIGIQKDSNNKFTKFVSDITINSPKRNYDAFMTIHNDRLLITGGDRLLARSFRPGTFMIYENKEWNNFDESIADNEIRKLIGTESWDYMGVAVDPDDENHYYIATYGEGIIELRNNEFVNLYSINNSTLKSANTTLNFVRIGSVCFDSQKNLWATNCLVTNAINVLKANGEWKSLYYSPLNNADKLDKILITSRGHKWVNVPYDNAKIVVIDDKGTIDDQSDDICNSFTSFKDAQSSTGGSITPGEFLCMAEDRNGTIWIGTNIGPLKCSTPSRAIDNPEQLACSRLVRDGEAYFLSGESVTAIAVDADNQKWIGTGSQGVFLINEDGSETIYNFNTDNSPLLSNTINSIAINNKTGEVFFGTSNGLVSFSSGVTSGSTPFSDVYAFPNPVRPEHNDKVTITGLTNNANVKITDINGNLIYQGRAVGNQLVWSCRNSNGNRVATGVYLVLTTTSDASESVVAKIAVVK
ncbi:MAG: T9SS type A sorting domain-containing protein [Tannerella sp.]|jgi:hypothetical protein|nr:T9SS type A sorting domain-containing protein [Tannerella sp.]